MSLISERQIADALSSLPGWSVQGGQLSKSFAFSTYMNGMNFAQACGALAETHDHHPDLLISWRKVDVSLSTHSEGGITEKDVDLAAEIEKEYSRWAS